MEIVEYVSLKASVSIAENIKRKTCLTPFITRNIIKHSGHNLIFKLCDDLHKPNIWASKLRHDLPQALSAHCVNCFGEIDKRHTKVLRLLHALQQRSYPWFLGLHGMHIDSHGGHLTQGASAVIQDMSALVFTSNTWPNSCYLRDIFHQSLNVIMTGNSGVGRSIYGHPISI